MKYYFLLIVFFSSCCIERGLDPEEYYRLCPYDLKYGRQHYLQVPIDFIPHKKEYKIGDTLTVQLNFSNSIYDITRDTYFTIDSFPFEPVNLLYHIKNNDWQSGYRINELIVDQERFNTRYNGQSFLSDDLRGHVEYENSTYFFEYKLVFETAGVYVSLMSDQYEVNVGSGNAFLNDDISDFQFEGRCPQSALQICNVVKGDSHIEDFKTELIYLDKEVYQDRLARIDNVDQSQFGNGSIPLEWTGAFCFEVVE